MTAEPAHHCQLLTPPSAGAIAIIRITGTSPASLVDTLFESAQGPSLQATPASRLRYGQIKNDGEVIDDIVAYRIETESMKAVELCCHGGIRVVERILDALGAAGARLASDKPQAWTADTRVAQETLELLPSAATKAAVSFLAWQRQNTPRWLLETADLCVSDAIEARSRVERFLAGAKTANRIIHGATVALIGPPNSGKSTLFNRLVGREAAIVSAAAGTTRDWVGASIEVSGMPVTLVDTAGRHVRARRLEQLAIEKGQYRAAEADMTVVVLDGSIPMTREDQKLISDQSASASVLVMNKCDIATDGYVNNADTSGATTAIPKVCISAINGRGIPELVEKIAIQLCASPHLREVPAAITARQVKLARRVLDALKSDGAAAARTITRELLQNSR